MVPGEAAGMRQVKVLLYREFETKEKVNINLLVIKLNIKAINNINRLQKKTFRNVHLSHIEHQKLPEIKRNRLQVAHRTSIVS